MKKSKFNKAALMHSTKQNYCFGISKYSFKIRVRFDKKDDIKNVFAVYGSLDFYKKQYKKPLEVELIDEFYKYYTGIISYNDPRISYVILIELKDGSSYYLSEEGLSINYDFSYYFYSSFTLSYLNEIDIIQNNKVFNGNIFYQIFPERFCLGDNSKDKSYINRDWYSLALKGSNNNCIQDTFIGGDLSGIIKKLDYIKDLGVNTIYMTPIYKSSTNHKYDVEDYFDIDPMFGNKKIFKTLVDEAHKRNMNVVIDLVFNHSSDLNPLFLDVKEKGKNSKYYDYYMVHGEIVKNDPINYETFGPEVKNMPKLNSNNFLEMDYFVEVGKYYIEKFNVDGYRLDVANEVSHTFWQNFKLNLRKIKPDIILIGECWNDASNFISRNEFESVMNYPFLLVSKKFFIDNLYTPSTFAYKLNSLLARYCDNTNKMMLNLLDSHDVERYFNFVKGDFNLYFLSFVTLIVYPGWPMIYYGDEIFMEGGRDPDNRRGMVWSSPYFNNEKHTFFKNILLLRQKYSSLKDGETKIYSKNNLVYIERFNNKEKVTLILNHSGGTKNILINKKSIVLSNLYSNNELQNNGFVVKKVKVKNII